MGLVTTVARRSLLQRPGRTLFSILGVAVGIATVVAIFTLDHNTILSRTMPGNEEWRADIEAHCRTQVAGYKPPRATHVVPDLNRHPSGKPDYRWAREQAPRAE